MKFKDILSMAYFRLHNKSSRIIIFALTFGLTMLLPIIWLLMSFYFDFQKQLDNCENLLFVNCCYNMYNDTLIMSGVDEEFVLNYRGAQLNTGQFTEVAPSASDVVTWTEFTINANNKLNVKDFDMRLNETTITLSKDSFTIRFADSNNGTIKNYPDSFENEFRSKFGRNIIYGNGFSTGKREVLVSERFLIENNLDRTEVLNKNLSFSINYTNFEDAFYNYFILDDDNVPYNNFINSINNHALSEVNYGGGKIQFFENFKIVGVVDKDYFNLNYFTNYEADLWMTEKALTNSQNISVIPEFSVQKVFRDFKYNNSVVITYPDTDYEKLSRRTVSDGAFFPFLVGNWFNARDINALDNLITPVKNSYMSFSNFESLKKADKSISDFIYNNKLFSQGGAFYRTVLETVNHIYDLEKTFDVVCIIFGCVGLVILVAVLNIYSNTMCFNYRKRMGFELILDYMGMSKKERRLLNFSEMSACFSISFIMSAIVGFSISVIIKLVTMKTLSAFDFLTLHLSYYPLSLLIGGLFLLSYVVFFNLIYKKRRP